MVDFYHEFSQGDLRILLASCHGKSQICLWEIKCYPNPSHYSNNLVQFNFRSPQSLERDASQGNGLRADVNQIGHYSLNGGSVLIDAMFFIGSQLGEFSIQ